MSLILNRRVGESIIIDGNIKVTVKQLSQGQVRISVEAPKEVRIDREEIHLKRLEAVHLKS